jgi:hypothetical protein
VRLSSSDLQLLDSVFAPQNIAGDRYNAAGMASLDRS